MSNEALVKKLQMKPGQRMVIINSPSGYTDQLGQLPEGAELADQPEGAFDFVHLFVNNVAELQRLAPTALAAVKRDGILWISYPKQTAKIKTDINRDTGWDALSSAGFRPVSQVSIDDIWSALRFRPTELVKKKS